VARSPYQSVYRTEVERIETPSAIAGNAMRLSMPSDTYSGPSIQAAPPWYSSAWSTFWGTLKDGQPLITDPRGSSSFSSGGKTYHVPNYVHDDSFHWMVGNLYHRAIVGDVIGAAETPLRFAANPTRYTRAVGAGLYNAVVNVPRLPQIWEQTPDYQREDFAFRIIGLGLGSAYGAGSVAAGSASARSTGQIGAVSPAAQNAAHTRGLGNPFKGKTPAEIAEMFKAKGFVPRGPDPLNGKGGYVNPKTGRSYHIDEANSFGEAPHVDVNRLKTYDGPLEKKKYFTGE
jgi:hypothetical protein